MKFPNRAHSLHVSKKEEAPITSKIQYMADPFQEAAIVLLI